MEATYDPPGMVPPNPDREGAQDQLAVLGCGALIVRVIGGIVSILISPSIWWEALLLPFAIGVVVRWKVNTWRFVALAALPCVVLAMYTQLIDDDIISAGIMMVLIFLALPAAVGVLIGKLTGGGIFPPRAHGARE